MMTRLIDLLGMTLISVVTFVALNFLRGIFCEGGKVLLSPYILVALIAFNATGMYLLKRYRIVK